MTTVSVIIPTYNRAHLIGRALQSVLDQTVCDLEVIVVDDASTDGTQEVVQSFRDPRIIFLRQSENSGASAARNAGMKEAKGEYIAFLDSDDEWMPQKLEKQLQVFKQRSLDELGIVTCGERGVGSTQSIWIPHTRGWVFEALLRHKRIGCRPPLLLIKRSCIQSVGAVWDTALRSCEEWDFMAQLAQSYQMDYCPEPLVTVHHHQGQRAWSPRRAIQAWAYLHDKYIAELASRPQAHSRFHLRSVVSCAAEEDWATARAQAMKALKANPREVVGYAWLGYVLGSQKIPFSMAHRAGLKALRAVTF